MGELEMEIASLGQGGDDGGGGQGCEDSEGDLNPAPGPFALDFAGAGVDEEAVDFLAVAVGADPDGQEDVFVGNPAVLSVHGEDSLLVAADVAFDEDADMAFHNSTGAAKAVGQVDLVTFGAEAAEVFILIGCEVGQVPGFEFFGVFARQGITGQDQDIVEEMADGAAGGIPAGFANLTSLDLGFAIDHGGVGFGFPIVFAALAGVMGGGLAVVGPVGDIHAL